MAEAEKEVAPAEIEFTPPLRPAQRSVSRRITCKANLTPVPETVKAGGTRFGPLLRREQLRNVFCSRIDVVIA